MKPEFKPETIRLVVGLGNPDSRYAHTYHNAGRIAMETLETGDAAFAPRCRFFTPDTFMNESGSAVARMLRVRGAKPSALLVVHDDADLSLGAYRLQFGRGAAGHHGVESVIASLGTKEFWRLRIGVRSVRLKNAKADAFVLRPMSREDEAAVEEAAKGFLLSIRSKRA